MTTAGPGPGRWLHLRSWRVLRCAGIWQWGCRGGALVGIGDGVGHDRQLV